MKRLLLASCLLLPACASIVEGSTQRINISTNPPGQMRCNASNSRGEWNVTTPGVLDLKRSKSDLSIKCEDEQYSGTFTNSSDIESWAFGNLLIPFGIIIGPVVDGTTGALFSYEDAITVPLTPKPSAAITTPMLDGMTVSPVAPQPAPDYSTYSPAAPAHQVQPQPESYVQPSAAPSPLPSSPDFIAPPSVR